MFRSKMAGLLSSFKWFLFSDMDSLRIFEGSQVRKLILYFYSVVDIVSREGRERESKKEKEKKRYKDEDG